MGSAGRVLLVLALVLAPVEAAGAAESQAALEHRLRGELERFLRAGAAAPPRAVEIPALADFAIAGIAPELVEIQLATRSTPPFRGPVPVTVSLSAGGRELKRGVVTTRLRIDAWAWVAARRLGRGDVIGAADLRRERVDLSELPPDAVRDAQAVIGLRLARSLGEGAPLRSGWVESVPVVSRGERVPLRLQRGSLRIDAVGEVREDARVGEWVRVLNLSSRREVSGRVDEQGVVHVRF